MSYWHAGMAGPQKLSLPRSIGISALAPAVIVKSGDLVQIAAVEVQSRANESSSFAANLRSGVSKPSVNQL